MSEYGVDGQEPDSELGRLISAQDHLVLAQDDYVATLYEQYGLPDMPSLGEMEGTIRALLGGAVATRSVVLELVLGRQVSTQELLEERRAFAQVLMSSASVDDKFTCLILEWQKQQSKDEE